MSNKWTDEQIHAIYDKPNILVSAAAGSGKTAVLVERIIRKIIPDENGKFTNITNLLVVTFARDAAGEMQERIRKALSDLMHEANSFDLRHHYRRQLKLVSQSDITTIDAFCINTIRKNFHIAGIEPGFRIMDTSEALVLKYELAEDLINRKYNENDDNFLLLNKHYSSVSSDYTVLNMIINLYEFSRSLPNPEKWLDFCVKNYEIPFEKSVFYNFAIEQKSAVISNALYGINNIINDLDSYTNDAECQSELSDEFKNIYAFSNHIKNLFIKLKTSDYNTTCEILKTLPPLPNKSSKRNDEAAYTKQIIDQIKPIHINVSSLSKYFYGDISVQHEISKRQHTVIKALVSLCNEFSNDLYAKKLEKNMFEFNDLEHMTLKLFKNNPEILTEYRNKYDEILMDEYQDTNGLQEAIFDAISKDNNRFMVGDMKQSIYRFRNSDPTIFKDKNKMYSKSTVGSSIALTKNFRSRHEVLDSVNTVFSSIMFENTAEIDYDETQKLNCGNVSYNDINDKNFSYKSEFHIIEDTNETDYENDEFSNTEAHYVAKKIRQLVDTKFKVFDQGTLRPIRYSDFAILASSTKSVKNDYVSILSKYGIEATVKSDGLLERSEIRLICCIMSVICNPYQDIPLICVMRSPLFKFTDDELAKIRVTAKGSFYEAVKAYSKLYSDARVNSFIDQLLKWRDQSKYTGANKMLWNIYTDTGLYDISPVLFDSDAQANLRLITDMAKTYEGTGYKGLYSFCLYIDMLRKNNVSIESVSEKKTDNCVNIMTIHKSKGLEFPVVFVVNASNKFGSSSKSLSMHKDLGIALAYSDYESRKTADTIQSSVIKFVKKNEETSESMRRLYVAMTRAKEKLYVIASTTSPSNSGSKSGIAYLKTKWQNTHFDTSTILSTNNFADWVAPCAMKNPDTWEFCEIVEYIDITDENGEKKIEKQYTDYITDKAIDSLLSRRYKFSQKADIPSRMYVTQLKNMNKEPSVNLKSNPSFMHETAPIGTSVGNAYHMALSVIHPEKITDIDSVKKELDTIADAGYITDTELNFIKPEKILKLFSSKIGKKMCSAKKLNRETSFEILVPAEEIFDGSDGDILVQGIIDCWFFDENDDIILIDYKSDNVCDASQLKERYKTQLKWYKYALEKIFKKTVSESYIYSISNDEWIKM